MLTLVPGLAALAITFGRSAQAASSRPPHPADHLFRQ
jgi:hypothetical protein